MPDIWSALDEQSSETEEQQAHVNSILLIFIQFHIDFVFGYLDLLDRH